MSEDAVPAATRKSGNNNQEQRVMRQQRKLKLHVIIVRNFIVLILLMISIVLCNKLLNNSRSRIDMSDLLAKKKNFCYRLNKYLIKMRREEEEKTSGRLYIYIPLLFLLCLQPVIHLDFGNFMHTFHVSFTDYE